MSSEFLENRYMGGGGETSHHINTNASFFSLLMLDPDPKQNLSNSVC